MNKTIQKLAQKKLRALTKKHSGITTVILDNWRGYRFIYDTRDVRACRNDCANCRLYQLLKGEPSGTFTARLKKASAADKKIFGPQNYLNCKTVEQYRRCYINFFNKRIKNRKQFAKEMALLNTMRILTVNAIFDTKSESRFRTIVRRTINAP